MPCNFQVQGMPINGTATSHHLPLILEDALLMATMTHVSLAIGKHALQRKKSTLCQAMLILLVAQMSQVVLDMMAWCGRLCALGCPWCTHVAAELRRFLLISFLMASCPQDSQGHRP